MGVNLVRRSLVSDAETADMMMVMAMMMMMIMMMMMMMVFDDYHDER